jgi:DNA-binding Lrp family transcriptional regulator
VRLARPQIRPHPKLLRSILEYFGAAQGVRSANVVAGSYDVIARVESANIDELGKLVVTTIQGVKGHPNPHLPGRSPLTHERHPAHEEL